MTKTSIMPSGSAYAMRQADDIHPATDEGFNIDFAGIRGVIWRQRLTLIAIIIASLVAGLLVTLLTTPIYRATATIQVDGSTEAYAIPGQVVEGVSRNYRGTVDEVLKSRTMSERVVDTLRLTSKMGADSSEKPEGMSQQAWQANKRRALAASLPAGLEIVSQPDSNIISVSYSSKDPKLAAAIANAYVDVFLKDGIERNIQKSEFARNYLVEQIRKLQAKLVVAERQSIDFTRAARIVGAGMLGSSGADGAQDDDATGTSAPATVQGSNLLAINQSYATARSARIAAEQRWQAVRDLNPSDIPEVQQDATVISLTTQRGQAATKLAELRTRYGDDYPEARELKVQIASLGQQIQQRGAEIKRGIRTAFELAQQQETGFADEVNKVSDQTLDEQARRVQLGQLERESAANRKQLNAMLTRYNDLTATANVTPSEYTKLDEALPPAKPISPNLVKNLLIAAILGIALAAAIAILLELFDDRLRSIEDLERKLRVAGLGVTPYVGEDSASGTAGSLDEAYSSIATAVAFGLPNKDHNVVSFTSSQASEGKSTTSFAVAKKLASHGRNVLLIDADLRKPSVATIAGFPRPKQGLAEVLLNEISLDDALLPPVHDGLSILPTGAIPTQPVEILSSPLFAEFVERCRANYSLVVIDSPPVIGIADAPIIASLADCTVFVVEANRVNFGQVKAALRRMRTTDANIIGAVLTKFQFAMAGQSYDYGYNYYQYGK